MIIVNPCKAFLFFSLFLIIGVTHAEVYKWVDEHGQIYYGDRPPTGAIVDHIDDQPSISPDRAEEGKLRLQRLLEQADKETERRHEKRRVVREKRDREREVLAIQEKRCIEARIQFDMLKEQMPVYWDAERNLRVSWDRDVYQGSREYLDDETRALEVSRVQKEILQHCRRPDDPAAQMQARRKQIRLELCEAAKIDLQALERPSSRATPNALQKQRDRVNRLCRVRD